MKGSLKGKVVGVCHFSFVLTYIIVNEISISFRGNISLFSAPSLFWLLASRIRT